MDRIVDVTVVLQRQVRPIQAVQKAVKFSAVPRSQLRGRHGCGQEFKTKSVREALEVSRTEQFSRSRVRWVQNVVTVVGRVRDGFSSKPDVAASFLPTFPAVANNFWTLRRPRSRLLRQRRTDDAASLPTTTAECSSQVPLGMVRGEARRFCLQAAHCEDVQTERCAVQ